MSSYYSSSEESSSSEIDFNFDWDAPLCPSIPDEASSNEGASGPRLTRVTDDMKGIILKSSDDKFFDVDIDVALVSRTIREKFYLLDGDEGLVPIPNVKSRILRKVIEWATHHVEVASQDAEEEDRRCTTGRLTLWEVNFLDVSPDMLIELIKAAHHLDIPRLMCLVRMRLDKLVREHGPGFAAYFPFPIELYENAGGFR